MCRAHTTSEASSLLPKSVSTLKVCRPSKIASALQAQDCNVLEMSPAVSGRYSPFCLGACHCWKCVNPPELPPPCDCMPT